MLISALPLLQYLQLYSIDFPYFANMYDAVLFYEGTGELHDGIGHYLPSAELNRASRVRPLVAAIIAHFLA